MGHMAHPQIMKRLGGAGVPARQSARTGWKACATDRKKNLPQGGNEGGEPHPHPLIANN